MDVKLNFVKTSQGTAAVPEAAHVLEEAAQEVDLAVAVVPEVEVVPEVTAKTKSLKVDHLAQFSERSLNPDHGQDPHIHDPEPLKKKMVTVMWIGMMMIRNFSIKYVYVCACDMNVCY